MKTDTCLTMDEFAAECRIATKPVKPTADNARHIPVTSEDNIARWSEQHCCRSDRWGHLLPGYPEEREPRCCPAKDELLL